MPESTPTDETAAPSRRKPVVLVIDDEPAITEILSNALACPEINVVAMNAMELALDGAVGIEYDIALIDIFMAAIGGIEGIRLMKERFPNGKLIAMSGGWSDLRAEHALRAARKIGADEVLGKPFDLPDVRSLVGRMVERFIGEEGETAAG